MDRLKDVVFEMDSLLRISGKGLDALKSKKTGGCRKVAPFFIEWLC